MIYAPIAAAPTWPYNHRNLAELCPPARERRRSVPVHTAKPMPEDFPLYAGIERNRDLMARYCVSKHLIARWRGECGVAARIGAPRLSAPKAPVVYRGHKSYDADMRPAGINTDAQTYLQKQGPVWRCTETGRTDPKGTHYMVYGRIRTADEMVAMAERKGWRADEWKEIAATPTTA